MHKKVLGEGLTSWISFHKSALFIVCHWPLSQKGLRNPPTHCLVCSLYTLNPIQSKAVAAWEFCKPAAVKGATPDFNRYSTVIQTFAAPEEGNRRKWWWSEGNAALPEQQQLPEVMRLTWPGSAPGLLRNGAASATNCGFSSLSQFRVHQQGQTAPPRSEL